MCVQAKLWCTTSRAKKVVVSLTLVAIIAEAINSLCRYLADVYVVNNIYAVVFKAIIPVAVFVINIMVVFKVRRSATNAAANLGVQQHHQSTSSNSVVPTVMLITTSLIYVLLYSTANIFVVLEMCVAGFSRETWVVVHKSHVVVASLTSLVFVYNFYVYLITGKRFRAELQRLFSCCLSASSSSSFAAVAATAAVVVADGAEQPEVARRDQADTTV